MTIVMKFGARVTFPHMEDHVTQLCECHSSCTEQIFDFCRNRLL